MIYVILHCSPGYECLGDTYLARGAHNAALKVFTYASQLNPAALYPRYQIAHIKQVDVFSYATFLSDYTYQKPLPQEKSCLPACLKTSSFGEFY